MFSQLYDLRSKNYGAFNFEGESLSINGWKISHAEELPCGTISKADDGREGVSLPTVEGCWTWSFGSFPEPKKVWTENEQHYWQHWTVTIQAQDRAIGFGDVIEYFLPFEALGVQICGHGCMEEPVIWGPAYIADRGPAIVQRFENGMCINSTTPFQPVLSALIDPDEGEVFSLTISAMYRSSLNVRKVKTRFKDFQ